MIENAAILLVCGEQKRQFDEYVEKIRKMDGLASIPPAMMRSLFELNSGFKVLADNGKGADTALYDRIKDALSSEDPQEVTDLRSINNGTDINAAYLRFWTVGKELIDAQYTKVDDRRHGSDCMVSVAKEGYKPVASSIRALRAMITAVTAEKKYPGEVIAVPSIWLVGLQFIAPDSRSNRAHLYTGFFGVKHQVQERDIHKSHQDNKWNLKDRDNIRALVLWLGDDALSVDVDDKNGAVIGLPGLPQAIIPHTRCGMGSSISQESNPCRALDHGVQAISKVTPSMTLIHDPPSDVQGTWYRGQLVCCLKDALTQPSTAMRHAAELSTAISSHIHRNSALEERFPNGFPPVIVIGSDGGPDHNPTFMSVKMSHIALFIKTNADMVLARRA